MALNRVCDDAYLRSTAAGTSVVATKIEKPCRSKSASSPSPITAVDGTVTTAVVSVEAAPVRLLTEVILT